MPKVYANKEIFSIILREKSKYRLLVGWGNSNFYSPNQPELEYYQTDLNYYYKWNNVTENFKMLVSLPLI